jgi:nitrogenase molybdenum-iron protein NifN
MFACLEQYTNENAMGRVMSMSRKIEGVKNVNENPCNMCMPMGGILAFKGIEQTMVVLHGSQGCSTYMRRHISQHFNEPIDVGSSSLNEKGTIYGGEENLKQAFDNILRVYHPQMIGVLTTCLAETIGEDVERIAARYLRQNKLNYPIVTAPTPGYGGSHAEGYFFTVRRIVEGLAKRTEKNYKINIFVANISPADIREIKRILDLMQVRYTLCPDFSDTLDRSYVRPYTKIPEGGTKLSDIEEMSGALATVQMGMTVDESTSPGEYLREEFGVPLYTIPIPIGLENTDIFVKMMQELTGGNIPKSLQNERGRLIDAMIDSHKYNFQGRSAIFGEPELVYALAGTCVENGIMPEVVATGSKSPELYKLVQDLLAEKGLDFTPEIVTESDFKEIRRLSIARGVNIGIGHSDGHYLEEHENIPLVRMGFPIHDRIGGQRILSVGYTGTAMFLDRVTNTLLGAKQKSYRQTMYDKFYRGKEKSEVEKYELLRV